jgi:hypothetical protein
MSSATAIFAWTHGAGYRRSGRRRRIGAGIAVHTAPARVAGPLFGDFSEIDDAPPLTPGVRGGG